MNKKRPQNKPKSKVTNATRLKGVSIRAQIRVDGKLKYIGTFESVEDAARAYDEWALRLHGDAAVTNESLGLL